MSAGGGEGVAVGGGGSRLAVAGVLAGPAGRRAAGGAGLRRAVAAAARRVARLSLLPSGRPSPLSATGWIV